MSKEQAVVIAALGTFVLGALAACGSIVGVHDVDVAPPDGTDSGSGGPDTGGPGPGPDGSTPDSTIPSNDRSVGGAVHFLQTGGSLVLANGAGQVTVSKSGAFSFPAKVKNGSDYAVTVATNPAGQRCFVVNGAGKANADVSNVEVRCSVVKSTSSAGDTASHKETSTTFVAIPAVAPISVDLDIPAKVLVTLTIPSMVTRSFPSQEVLGIQIDGGDTLGLQAGGAYPEQFSYDAYTSVVASLGVGKHSLQPVWRLEPSGAGTNEMEIFHDAGPTTANAIVLDSLPSYDKAQGASVASVTSNSSATFASLGIGPITLAPAAPAPAFLAMRMGGVGGSGTTVRLLLDGTPLATGWTVPGQPSGSSTRLMNPSAIATLGAGSHTIGGDWNNDDGSDNARQIAPSAGAAVEAVLFKPGTATATKDISVTTIMDLTADYVQVPGLSTTINPARPTKVLATFSSSMFRTTPNWPQTAEAAFFVNGVLAQSLRYTNPNNLNYLAHGATMSTVVDVPAGAVTVEVRARVSTPSDTGRGQAKLELYKVTNLSAIALE